MTATGIPPHILLANEIAKIRGDMEEQKITIIEKLEELPKKIKDMMLENFQVNGTIPITQEQVTNLFNQFSRNIRVVICLQHSTLISNQNNINSSNINADLKYKVFNWGGKMHLVLIYMYFPYFVPYTCYSRLTTN